MSDSLTVPLLTRTARKAAPSVCGDYIVRLAAGLDDLHAAQRLRYAVFCSELGEGLAGADELGRDEDRFDAQFDHLLLCARDTGAVVGTYRLQTADAARAGAGFYCDDEFMLGDLPAAVLANAIELGRACIAKEHRRSTALLALWRGLADYLQRHRKRFLFGCCSLTGVDPQLARIAARWLREQGHQHGALHAGVRPALQVADAPVTDGEVATFRLPQLFGTYLRHGAKVCGGPALDHDFGTTDFLIVLDAAALSARQRSLFFADA